MITKTCSCILELKDMVEEFQLQVIGAVSDYFSQTSTLPDDADITKNLFSLYKLLEDVTVFPPEICTKVLNCINHLSFQNTAPIRFQMKTAGLFSIRDSFILILLRCGPTNILAEFISYFSFESITDQHKFRDSGGILYLLNIFHAAHPDINLQASVGIIIRDVLSHIDDNKKVISKYIDDVEVVENFFPLTRR